MKRDAIAVKDVIDEAGGAVARVAAPWLGVFWLSALPVRLLQVHLLDRATSLGDSASKHGYLLWGIAACATAAFLLSIAGRAVFVRACLLSLTTRDVPGRETWRMPPGALASYTFAALLLEVLFFALAFTLVALPILVLFSGLAAATAFQNEQPGLVRPLARIFSAASSAGELIRVLLVFGLALAIAICNLFVAVLIVLWMLEAVPGLDLSGWIHLFRPAHGMLPWPEERLPALLVMAGAALAVEPFWLASMAAYVRKRETRQTGEDLSQWFQELKGEAST